MAVLSSVTFLMVHFHLCYSGGAKSSVKHSPARSCTDGALPALHHLCESHSYCTQVSLE